MKKQILIVGLLMISALTFGQKKEIKTAQKEIKNGNFSEAISTLKGAEVLISNADSSVKEQYYLVIGQAYLGGAGNDYNKMNSAADAFEKVIKLNKNGKYSADAEIGLSQISDALINSAILDQNAKNNKIAAKKLYRSYNIKKQDSSLKDNQISDLENKVRMLENKINNIFGETNQEVLVEEPLLIKSKYKMAVLIVEKANVFS